MRERWAHRASMPRARGRASAIKKRTSHITLALTAKEIVAPVAKVAKAKKVAAPAAEAAHDHTDPNHTH